MLTFKQAVDLAANWVRVVWADKAVLVEGGVLKRPYGWVFFYQSRGYVETGDPERMMGGNAPILVERCNGEIRVTGTGAPLDAYLAAYEKTIAPARLTLPLPDEP
jgi:hypothetical protein